MADEKVKIKEYSDRYKKLIEGLKTAKKSEDAKSLQSNISALDSWATEVKGFLDSLNGTDITNEVAYSELRAIYNSWANSYTRAEYIDTLNRITTRAEGASGESWYGEFEKIKANLSPESKAILEGNVSDYTSFNTAPVQADINQLTALINKIKKEAGFGGADNASGYAAISQGTVVKGLSEVKQYRDTLQAALGHANFEKKKKAALNNPPEEKAPERKEPELNIDKYSGQAANVDVNNLVNGLSHADEVGYAKSTLDGTEDTLKDTGDYITARDKNLTKEEEKQYRADLEANAYGRNARINDNIARGSKGENANNRSFETTLRYSRLADALNNRVHTRASLPSVVSFSAFGPSANIAGQRAELYQMPKIETEEMRQMNTVRDLSKDQSGRQINRQQNYRDAAQELTANEMQDKLKLQTELSKRLMDRRDKFTDEEMRQWYQTRYDEEMNRKATEWEKKFGRDFGIESAKFIAEMNKTDPTLAAIMGKAIDIVPPDYVQQFLTEVLMPYGRAIRAGEPVSKVIERAAYDFGNFAANGLYGFTKGGFEGIMDALKEIF